MSVLEVTGLKKHFGGVIAVDDVAFSVAAGELLALIGPNGAGKTTCFNMLNGQLRPDDGHIRLGGVDITGARPRDIWRLGVGRTFQITQTYGSMSVLENVQMTLLSYHQRLLSFWSVASAAYRDEAMHLLEQVGMEAQADRGCGVLAYGDLKRVELAVALAHRPRLLLMDEPTAGMAPRERIELMQLTADLVRRRHLPLVPVVVLRPCAVAAAAAAQHVAVLFTEHDMDVVFTHASQIIVLNRGRIIARGSPEQVRNDPQVREVYLGSGLMYH